MERALPEDGMPLAGLVEAGARPPPAWETWQMDNGNDLPVGSVSVCAPDLVGDALLAIFRDDMAKVTVVPFALSPSEVGRCVEDAVFRAPGQVIAARLDVMGIDAALVLAGLDRTL